MSTVIPARHMPFFAFALVILASSVAAQISEASPSAAVDRLSPFETYVVWTNRPNCTFAATAPSDPQTDGYNRYISSLQYECSGLWNHGNFVRNIKGPQLYLLLQCQDAPHNIECIAYLKNLMAQSLEIDPAKFWIQEVLPQQKRFEWIPPEKIARSIERQARWASALAGFGSAFATQQVTGTATGNDGDYDVRMTMPDTAAQNRTAAENVKRKRAARETAASVIDAALQRHTLLPQSDIAGFIFFQKDKHFQLERMHLPLGETDYVFVFTAPEKKH